jgi:hypothetical protein
MKYLFLLLLVSCTKTAKLDPSYELDVKPILQFKCYSCHGNLWLSKSVFDTNLIKIQEMVVIQRRMPPSPLNQYEYDTIKNYIDNRLKD